MIVLIENNVVISRGVRFVLHAERQGRIGVRAFLPSDTRFDRVDGGYLVAQDQPQGWADRKADGEELFGKIHASLETGRALKLDSTPGLVARVSRIEMMLETILEQMVEDRGTS